MGCRNKIEKLLANDWVSGIICCALAFGVGLMAGHGL